MKSERVRPARVTGFVESLIVLACGVMLLLSTACGGSSPPPDDASNADDVKLLEDDQPAAGEVGAPASEEVKRGEQALEAQDFQTAKDIFEKLHAEDPSDARASYYLALSLEGLGETEQALGYYEKALQADPKLTVASLNLSAALLESGDTARALKVVDAALKQAPEDEQLLLNRAMARAMSGDAKGAADDYGKLIAKTGEPPVELLYGHAEALVAAGDEKQARAAIDRLLENPAWEVLVSAADLLRRLKAFDDCIATANKAHAKKPAAELLVLRGRCKRGKKDNAGAKADFEAAVAANPNYAQGHYYLGRHLQKVDKKNAPAREHLEKALKLAGAQTVYGQLAQRALKEF